MLSHLAALDELRAPHFYAGDPGVENIDILQAHGIAGAHHGRYIMRIENILQHNGDVGLALVQYRCKPVLAFGCHSALKSKI